jgi:hypothetical protein
MLVDYKLTVRRSSTADTNSRNTYLSSQALLAWNLVEIYHFDWSPVDIHFNVTPLGVAIGH